jgi:hypothetical protein
VAHAVTDAFGDFKFDRLSSDSGAYRLDICKDGKTKASVDVTLGTSLSVGTIWI